MPPTHLYFAAAEQSLLGYAPLAPLEPDDEQPPKLQPAVKRKAIPLSKLKTATLPQVLACSQYWQKDEAKAKLLTFPSTAARRRGRDE